MVLCVHNDKEQLLYIAENRCGSTTLSRITASNKFPELTTVDSYDLYKFIRNNPNIKIIWPLRGPIARCVSGTQVIRIKLDTDKLLDNYINTTNNFGIAPYHLYDSHIDHILLGAAYIAANGYDIRFLDLDNFSSHLSRLYPDWDLLEGINTKNNYYRVNSSSVPKKENLEYFAFYHSWIYSRKLTPRYTWLEWMLPELILYRGIQMFNVTRDISEITRYLHQYLESPTTLAYNSISSGRHQYIITVFNRNDLEVPELSIISPFWEE